MFHDFFSNLSWSRTSQNGKEKKASKAAPGARPSEMTGGGANNPYVRPHPEGRSAPYVAANFDFADNATYPNYDQAISGREQWKNDTSVQVMDGKIILPPGTYPAAGEPPDDWHGYKMRDWQESQANEHVINADEGLPLFGNKRYHPALNPYWNKIPNTRVQRAPHEYDFRRRYDQWSKRNLTGEVYAAGNIGLTSNPAMSLKGMAPQRHRRSTHRVEPIEMGENIYSTGPSPRSPSAVYSSGNAGFGPGYALT